MVFLDVILEILRSDRLIWLEVEPRVCGSEGVVSSMELPSSLACTLPTLVVNVADRPSPFFVFLSCYDGLSQCIALNASYVQVRNSTNAWEAFYGVGFYFVYSELDLRILESFKGDALEALSNERVFDLIERLPLSVNVFSVSVDCISLELRFGSVSTGYSRCVRFLDFISIHIIVLLMGLPISMGAGIEMQAGKDGYARKLFGSWPDSIDDMLLIVHRVEKKCGLLAFGLSGPSLKDISRQGALVMPIPRKSAGFFDPWVSIDLT